MADFKQALPILFLIFIAVLCLIFLTRVIFFFLLNKAYKRYLVLKEAGKKLMKFDKKNFIKEDEELSRKKDEKQKTATYEVMASKEQQLDNDELNKVDIVDIVKPIGFWTSMILGQKLSYLIQSAQILNKRTDKGFWVSMIEAKDRQAGRQHGRGR